MNGRTASCESPLFPYYESLVFQGITLMIDPTSGDITEGPKLPFEAALTDTI